MKTLIDDTVKLIEIENKQEAIELGRGAGWCTSPTSGRNYYDTHYHPGRGRLFVVRKRRPEYQIFSGKERNHLEIRGRGNSTTYLPKLLDKYPILTDFFESTLGIMQSNLTHSLHNRVNDAFINQYRNNVHAHFENRRPFEIPMERLLGASDRTCCEILERFPELHISVVANRPPIRIRTARDNTYHGVIFHASQTMPNNQQYNVTQIVGDDVIAQQSRTNTIISHTIRTLVMMLERKWLEIEYETNRGRINDEVNPNNIRPARYWENDPFIGHRPRLPGNEP